VNHFFACFVRAWRKFPAPVRRALIGVALNGLVLLVVYVVSPELAVHFARGFLEEVADLVRVLSFWLGS
jgi:hypothetical protein